MLPPSLQMLPALVLLLLLTAQHGKRITPGCIFFHTCTMDIPPMYLCSHNRRKSYFQEFQKLLLSYFWVTFGLLYPKSNPKVTLCLVNAEKVSFKCMFLTTWIAKCPPEPIYRKSPKTPLLCPTLSLPIHTVLGPRRGSTSLVPCRQMQVCLVFFAKPRLAALAVNYLCGLIASCSDKGEGDPRRSSFSLCQRMHCKKPSPSHLWAISARAEKEGEIEGDIAVLEV